MQGAFERKEITLDPRWFSSIGLIFDLVGSVILVTGLFISKKDALELGLDRWASEKEEDNLLLPKVVDRLKQSNRAKIGLIFLLLGILFQLIGTWAK